MDGEEENATELTEEPNCRTQPQPRPLHKHYKRRVWLAIGATSMAVILTTILGAYFGLHSRGSGTGLPSSPSPPSSSASPLGSGSPSTPLPVATLQASPPKSSFPAIQESFVSFAVELLFFPDFAGNHSSPNTFSDTLLNNIGNISGTKPYIRVGGNSQDLAIYDAALPTATKATWLQAPNMHPEDISIGPSFFEGYSSFPGTKFIHGFNMKNATNSAAGWQSLLDTVPVACKALEGRLLWWEYGNEPDVYPRPSSAWNDTSYVADWHNGTSAIQKELARACPNMASGNEYGYVGPSLLGTNKLLPVRLYQGGLNDNGVIKQDTMHHYMGDAMSPGVNLQRGLMNHTAVASKLAGIATEITNLNNPSLINPSDPRTQIPFTLDEANSFLNGNSGPPNFLNVFGSALWTVDYMLWCATIGLSRVHMQQGTGFLYNSWEPVPTPKTGISTLPPFYGNIMVASMLGDITEAVPHIINIPLDDLGDLVSAYACYVNGNMLVRVAVIDLHEYNVTSTAPRGHRNYTFSIPSALNIADGSQVGVQRLLAAGSDVRYGMTWDGWSYAYELNEGHPVRMQNVTTGETVKVNGDLVTVELEDSSAAILNFT
ncbi:hypothetical protein MMC30_005825 [Trapelia coarctata]|nr:hypothetical protein [Trapelia coarctata]